MMYIYVYLCIIFIQPFPYSKFITEDLLSSSAVKNPKPHKMMSASTRYHHPKRQRELLSFKLDTPKIIFTSVKSYTD